MSRLLKPFTDRHGQEFVSMNLAAVRMKMDRENIRRAVDKKFVRTYKLQGAKCVKWPQAKAEYEKYKEHTARILHVDEVPPDDLNVDAEEDLDEGEAGKPRGPGRPKDVGQLTATATKTAYAGQLLRLEYETKLGKLVPADVIEFAWSSIAESVKKAMLSIPDRCAAIIAGESNRERYHDVHRTLTSEINSALTNMELVDVAVRAAKAKSVPRKSEADS